MLLNVHNVDMEQKNLMDAIIFHAQNAKNNGVGSVEALILTFTLKNGIFLDVREHRVILRLV